MKVRLITIGSISAGGKEVPSLRISGQWLAKIGFRFGKKAIISEQPGLLTIQLISFEEPELREAVGEYHTRSWPGEVYWKEETPCE
jgi:hypothetical protein